MIKRSRLLAINFSMFILLITQIITGIRLWLSHLGRLEESGLWTNAHIITGLGLVALVMIHLYMNRRWVKTQFVDRHK